MGTGLACRLTEKELEAKVKELSEKFEALEKDLQIDLTGYSIICPVCFKEGLNTHHFIAEKVSLSLLKQIFERKMVLMPSDLYHSWRPLREGLIT